MRRERVNYVRPLLVDLKFSFSDEGPPATVYIQLAQPEYLTDSPVDLTTCASPTLLTLLQGREHVSHVSYDSTRAQKQMLFTIEIVYTGSSSQFVGVENACLNC